jgi:hypothetical protein
MGNKLAYADTYEQALAQLTDALKGVAPPTPAARAEQTAVQPRSAPAPAETDTLRQIRDHMQRYRDLSSQGKWAEAGKELEEIQRLALK